MIKSMSDIFKGINQLHSEKLVVGQDYYIENGLWVFTEKYHLKKGICCGNKCKHCPYNHINVPKN